MNILTRIERWFLPGEVVRDYGDLQGDPKGTRAAFLCRQEGKLRLVIRNASIAPLGLNKMYSMIDLTPQTLQRLGEIISDAKQHLDKDRVA